MIFEQGEIILVPFPFSNLRGVKRRPVLVLSKDGGKDIITCGMTSNLRNKKNSILIEKENLVRGFIPSTSLIKIDKLFTLDRKIVIKKI